MQDHLNALFANTPTVRDCLALFFADATKRAQADQLQETTRRSYVSYAKYIDQRFLDVPIGALRRAVVKGWHLELAARINPQTSRRLTAAADNALRFLAMLYRWVDVELELKLPSSPTSGIRHAHKTIGARALGNHELARYREEVRHYQAERVHSFKGLKDGHPRRIAAYNPTVALRLLDLTGCRPAEVRTLRIELHLALDSDYPMLTLTHTKADDGGGRPLSAAAVTEIRQHLARCGNPTSGWLFPSYARPGHCLSDGALTDAHKAVCRRAKIKASRYSLRHTLVTHAFAGGFDSTATSGAVGHDREKSFKQYRHVIPRESFALVEAHSRDSGRAA